MEICNYSDYKKTLEIATEIILNGGIILYPTDTIYGLGCNGLNKKAVEKIENIKDIKIRKPISAMFGHIEIIKQYCKINEEQEKILIKYLPGPYTFILPLKKQIPLSMNNTLGVRIPNNKFCIDLGKIVKIPIASTSANLNGKEPQDKLENIDKIIREKVDLIVDYEQPTKKEASTVVDITDIKNIKLIRQGAGEFKL